MSEVEFELGEHSFKLGPLKVKDSMKGWAIVAHVLLPLLAELASDEKNLSASIANAIAGVERLPELQELFSKVCKVEWSGKSVPVKDFQELIFARRPALLLAWLAECIAIEYGEVLGKDGRELLARAASRFGSLTGMTAG